ncbi:MAG: ROK family transcriptional regulator [Acidimicrobiales bacterium]
MSVGQTPARPADMRSHNLALVLRSVVQEPASRAEVAASSGLTKAAVSSLVDDLIERRLLAEEPPAVTGRGRPPRQLRLHAQAPTAVGLELNVDYVAAVRTNLAGQELAAHRIDRDMRLLPLRHIVRQLTNAWDAVTRPTASGRVLGTGLAVAGIVDSSGTVLRAPNLPVLSGVNIVQEVVTALRHPEHDVTVDNEANLAALAELHQPAAEQSFVYVTGEIGVGAGIVINGELFRGASGMAGELGHVPIERGGRQCGCGGRGCVEQYAGQEALLTESGSPTLEALVGAVEARRPRALSAVAAAGAALGTGLASTLNIVDVPTVVLGGVYARLFDAIAPAVRSELAVRVLASNVRLPLVRAASTGADAAVRGAVSSVVQRTLANDSSFVGTARF